MTGDAMFSEVFLAGARVPAADIIGELGAGWGVALTTLAHERTGLGTRPGRAGYGGSNQIQHNVIGERVLGLPKEPDVPRDVPFRDLKKECRDRKPGRYDNFCIYR